MRGFFRSQLIMALLALPVLVSGCVVVPFVQAFKESGFTENDRMALLGPKIKRFSDARMFGNRTEALTVVAPESRVEISKQLSEVSEEERVVKSQIDHVEWLNEARKAKVFLKVDSYRVTQLVVNTATEEQMWEFSTTAGWQLSSRSKVQG